MVRKLVTVCIICYVQRMPLNQSDRENGAVSSIFKAVIFKFVKFMDQICMNKKRKEKTKQSQFLMLTKVAQQRKMLLLAALLSILFLARASNMTLPRQRSYLEDKNLRKKIIILRDFIPLF